MTFLRPLAVCSLVLGFAALPVFAQPAPSATAPAVVAPASPPDAARMEIARQIVQGMKFRETLSKALDSDTQNIKMRIDRAAMMMPAGAATPAEVDEYKKKMLDLWTGSFQLDPMVEEVATAYAELFTIDQLKSLLAFYQSSAGQAWIEKTPELAKRTNQTSQSRANNAMVALTKYDSTFRQAHAPKAAPAAPKPSAPAATPTAPSAPAPSAAAGHTP